MEQRYTINVNKFVKNIQEYYVISKKSKKKKEEKLKTKKKSKTFNDGNSIYR